VLVCGDANFNFAGAVAARKLRLTLGHVEAGLRSEDWRMPEEHNRVMIDHISDYLFAPTEEACQNATKDNVKGDIILTGNTVVDVIQRNINIAHQRSNILEELELNRGDYFVLTAHREENVDNKEVLSEIIEITKRLISEFELPVMYPIHPRTEKRLNQFGLYNEYKSISGLQLIDPLGYLDFLELMSGSELALTDSGGVQEETCILGVPCVTLRESTERPETVEVGSNTIAGTDPTDVIEDVRRMRAVNTSWNNPFGDGNAAEKIIDTVLQE
jgi:UDP-N-acetylglucosamine 2-epimerase (non-hydrolysing)